MSARLGPDHARDYAIKLDGRRMTFECGGGRGHPPYTTDVDARLYFPLLLSYWSRRGGGVSAWSARKGRRWYHCPVCRRLRRARDRARVPARVTIRRTAP